MRANVKSVLTLFAICAVVALMLAVTNFITAPVIAENEEKAFQQSMLEVLPDGERFEKVDVSGLDLPSSITEVYTEAGGGYDKVLVDAPCSNTGVLRRRPDARWNWSEEKLGALVALQAQILDEAAALAKPGGTLVYSTCSNEPEENADQVNAFLARHPGASLVCSEEAVPFVSGTDGAFAAKIALGGEEARG